MATVHKVYEVLKMLKPYDIDLPKERIGGEFDGGYIMAANRTPDQTVLSYGIAGDVSFDLKMAMSGHQIYMFDHTIPGLPGNHPYFHFFKEGVSEKSDPSQNFYSLEDHLQRFSIQGNRLILKMDVEGAEWDVFRDIPESVLTRFEQLALEVHHFGRMRDPEFLDKVHASLKKITQHFTLFHVHVNNNNAMEVVSGFSIYNLLELSFIKTYCVSRRESKTLYPTDLDNPNEQGQDDYLLSIFPFWPYGLEESTYTEHVRKFNLKNNIIVQSALRLKEANYFLKSQELEKAEFSLRECLELRSYYPEATGLLIHLLNQKAIQQFNMQKFTEAVSCLREALSLAPENPSILRNLEIAQAAESATLVT